MVIAVALAVTACASLPPIEARKETHALVRTDDTRLGRAIAPLAAAHPGKSGIHALTRPTDAYAARIVLALAAEKSIDVQYYIWRDDQSGIGLFESLWMAAGRGVRIRLLLDDANTKGLDETLAVFAAHPNVEVRLYNPFASRGSRLLGYMGDFSRLNRRMHNKSFTVDNQATIVGGRNIGNEYFGVGDEELFADLDVLAFGQAVQEVSDAFDLYWNSASAYPALDVIPHADEGAAARMAQRFEANREDPASKEYVGAARDTALVRDLLARKLPIEWTEARAVRDDPAKTLDTTERRDLLMLTDLLATFGRPEKSFYLVSPYFVPGKEGVAALTAMAHRGVTTVVLTNSLGATDVGPVHAGYSKSREALLDAGVKLYELKPTSTVETEHRKKKGSSPESLHAKTFALDDKRIFVGSFNFDPRSALLNTEMGLVIDSPALAGALTRAFEAKVPENAYEVRKDAKGSIVWVERTPAGEVVHDDEPGAGALRRAWIEFLSWLPIDWLL